MRESSFHLSALLPNKGGGGEMTCDDIIRGGGDGGSGLGLEDEVFLLRKREITVI